MEAVDLAEIEQEKESISMAMISLKLYNKDITQENLETELKKQSGHTATKVEYIGDGSLLAFFPCKRVYVVEKNGDVKYIGKEDEINEIFVIADKESDLTSKQIQAVKITVKQYNAEENDSINIQYAWNQSKKDEPKTYKNATIEEGTTIAIIDSGEQPTGNYYLWLKVKVGNTEEIKRTYGEYYIQEYTTLVNTNNEKNAESGFLGNTDIKRGNIRSVTFTNSINGPTDEDVIYWNPSNKDSEVIRAWYTTEEIDGVNYYDVTIGQDGKVIANANSVYLFANIGTNLTETTTVTIQGLENLDTSNVINMNNMFSGCSKLTSLNLSNFDTSSVRSMQSMFNGCSKLTSLNLSSFNTSSVTTMQSMFSSCTELTSLNISNFDTSNVTSMTHMFSSCTELTSLNLSSFNTSSVTSMQGMFNSTGLTSLNLSNFNTSNVTNMLSMFNSCTELTSLNISNFNTSNVTNMQSMFNKCSKLTSLDVSHFDTSNVTSMTYMFYSCGIESIDVSNFDTSSVTSMAQMFYGCKVENLNLSNFDTSNITTVYRMFCNCKQLNNLDLSNWVISEELNADEIFKGIKNNCEISVSSQEMADWVLDKNEALTNIIIK